LVEKYDAIEIEGRQEESENETRFVYRDTPELQSIASLSAFFER
jgi:hypothetical protein